MSQHKFNEVTFLTSDNSFWEFESFETLKNSIRETTLNSLIGYFPPSTNTTYEELQKQKEEHWTVCYIELATGSHLIKHFSTTLELHLGLEHIKQIAESENHISIFKTKDFVYYNERGAEK